MTAAAQVPAETPPADGMRWVPGGELQLGSEDFDRPAARQAESVETSTGHIGFRCIVRRPPAD